MTSSARWRLRADPELCDRVVAETADAGASGFEAVVAADGSHALDEEGRQDLLIYAPSERVAEIEALLKRTLAGTSARLGAAESVPVRDWTEAYRRAARPIDVSPRLRIRPPFSSRASPTPLLSSPAGPTEVVIEPRQAFGTGSHASTALALRWLDRSLRERPGPRLLDVGCGSGVLAIAGVKLGARCAAACDCDPVAAREARENAARNGARVGVWCGSLTALARDARFDLVLANMIRSELDPLLPALLGAAAPSGWLVISGLLAAERTRFEAGLAARGARAAGVLGERDERGDHWIALRIEAPRRTT